MNDTEITIFCPYSIELDNSKLRPQKYETVQLSNGTRQTLIVSRGRLRMHAGVTVTVTVKYTYVTVI